MALCIMNGLDLINFCVQKVMFSELGLMKKF